MSDITSPCCGAELSISMQTVGPPYMTYETPDEIECEGERCFNSWTPAGRVIRFYEPEGGDNE